MADDLTKSLFILTSCPDYKTGKTAVERFFAKNVLVKYDTVHVVETESVSAQNNGFWPAVDHGVSANRHIVKKMVDELQEEGFGHTDSWDTMGQGYASSTLHTIAHMLDGFFGIDSVFYNLVEDSHWLSPMCLGRIKADPGAFWLFTVEVKSEGPDVDRVPFMRPLGTE